MHRSLRLRLDRSALQSNWQWLTAHSGVQGAAAVKADGYGLGARAATFALYEAGCRTFYVSTWDEVARLGLLPNDCEVSVLHGVGADDLQFALRSDARPVLNSAAQVAQWKAAAPTRPCDVMIDTGMNRLGLRPEEGGVLDGLTIDTLMSHLACADQDQVLNSTQRKRFADAAATIPARRRSLANSAGVLLGRDYAFDLVRPGLALFGGIPRREGIGHIRQVAHVDAQVVQRRTARAGETVGYGATITVERDTELAILNIGYADGYFRAFAGVGRAKVDGAWHPLLGRVSMDLVALDCSAADALAEGDWVELDFDLPAASTATGISQYELLTGLGNRFDRRWS